MDNMIKITHGQTGESGEIFPHMIQGYYISKALNATVLVIQGGTFVPIKEKWNEITDQLFRETEIERKAGGIEL